MKKVLFILDEYYPQKSAPSVRINSFISELSDYEVHVLGGFDSNPEPLNHHNIVVSRPSEKKFFSFALFLLKMNFEALSATWTKRYDVVVTSIPKYELLFSFPLLRANKKVLDVRDSFNFVDYDSYFHHFISKKPAKFFGNLAKKFVGFFFNRSLKNADLVTVANQGIQNSIKQSSFIVANGVNTDLFNPANFIKPQENIINIVYVGNFAEKDSFDLIVEVLPRLGGMVKLHLVGAGRNKEKLLHKFASFNISVVDHGIVPHKDLPSLLSKMDVGFIFRRNDTQESLPVAIFEFVSMNIPTITNNFGLMNSFVNENKLGITVGSAAEFEKALVQIKNDPWNHLHDKAVSLFSRKTEALKFKDHIARIIS